MAEGVSPNGARSAAALATGGLLVAALLLVFLDALPAWVRPDAESLWQFALAAFVGGACCSLLAINLIRSARLRRIRNHLGRRAAWLSRVPWLSSLLWWIIISLVVLLIVAAGLALGFQRIEAALLFMFLMVFPGVIGLPPIVLVPLFVALIERVYLGRWPRRVQEDS